MGDSSLRASDADREQAAQELRDHYADGRLDADELSSRLEAVYAARTTGELERLKVDLPPLPVSAQRRRAEIAEYRGDLRRQLMQQTGAALVPFLVCVAVWASDGAQGGNFWPAFLLIFPLIFLVRNGWALYGPAPDLERVEAELRHSRRAGHHRRHRGRGGRYVRSVGPGAPAAPHDPGEPGPRR